MLRRLFVGLSFAGLMLGLTTACSKTNSLAPVSGQVPQGEVPAEKSLIVGNWKLVGITYQSQNSESPVGENVSHVFVFSENGDMSYLQMFYGSKEIGSYSLEGDELKRNFTGGTVSSSGITLTQDELVLPDANPAISTVKQRHYKRISDDDVNALITQYNIQ